MTGFMADFDADLGRPFAVAAAGGARRLLTVISQQSLSFTIPAGASSADIVVVGGGGGTYYSGGQQAAANGGGGAIAVSSITVTPGDVLTTLLGAGGFTAYPGSNPTSSSAGGASSVPKNGVTVAYAPGGGVSNQTPGPVSQCVGNVFVGTSVGVGPPNGPAGVPISQGYSYGLGDANGANGRTGAVLVLIYG